MVSETITVQITDGLDTRPIALLVQLAGGFRSSIYLSAGHRQANAKSIMGMMALGLDNGEKVEISAEGPDEKEAVKAIREYLTRNR